jgi:hypothetical protein
MLVTILVAEIMLAIFLGGELIIVLAVTMRHGDPSATYKLYAVRDKLIEAAVFKGVERENPWLDALYENTNRVLLHSNLLGGPRGWSLAAAVGHYRANHPNTGKELQPFPASPEECPDAIRELAPELRAALEYLVCNHRGIGIQMNAQEREQRRIQRETARKLLQMMLGDVRCGCPA